LNCICGESNYNPDIRAGFITDNYGESKSCDVPIGKCKCGIIRHVDLPFGNAKEYGDFYAKYPPASNDYTAKSYDADLNEAEKAFNRLSLSGKILDIGCGSGALVDVCRKKGLDAYGCELARYHTTVV